MQTPDAEAFLAGLNEWVAIESKTDEPASIGAMMSRAMAEFRAAGLHVTEVPGTDGFGPHFHAVSPWGEGPGLLILCHLDTVHPTGGLVRNPIRVEGDHAYGPGIYDMKGGVYIALTAIRTLIEAGRQTPLPVRFLVVSDEEVGSPTSQAHIVTAAENAAYVLVTEPARDGGCCVTGRKGVARMKIAAHGRPAHSGAQHQNGISAIREIARQVERLEAMTDYERGVTVNIGLIGGGSGANVVPEHAWAEIDIRMLTPADGETVVREVRALEPVNPGVSLEVTGGMNRPPYQKTNSVAALYDHARGLAAEIGFELGDTFTGGGSDGNFTASIAPTLDGLGVDGAGAHTSEEHIYVSSLVPRMLLLRRLMETLR
ncbi:MAG: M20 family metallopeptidase [Pseudomonadota bacterium]